MRGNTGRKVTSDRFWDFLKKWYERLKILFWFAGGIIGGLASAWVAVNHALDEFDKYITKKVNSRISEIADYSGSIETKIVAPGSAQDFKVQCKAGDIPLTFTIDADINNVDPILQVSRSEGSGFSMRIANGAGSQHAPGPITVTPLCLRTRGEGQS
jgi:hypothetical protein